MDGHESPLNVEVLTEVTLPPSPTEKCSRELEVSIYRLCFFDDSASLCCLSVIQLQWSPKAFLWATPSGRENALAAPKFNCAEIIRKQKQLPFSIAGFIK